MVRPNICPNSPAAIGERMELRPHANSTASGRVEDCAVDAGIAAAYPFQCSTVTSVNRRRAVSKSTSTLRLSRSIRM